MHSPENTAHFFDWLATPIEGLIKIIESDFAVFSPDQLYLCQDQVPNYVRDRITGTCFHHQFPLYDSNVPANFLLHYESFSSKFRYLAERFREYATRKSVTFVRSKIAEADAFRLEEIYFDRFPNSDARFLYLLDSGDAFTTRHGHARVLNVPGSVGDPVVWANMLLEEGLISEPFRHGTAEILGHTDGGYNLDITNRFTEEQMLAAVDANRDSFRFPLELAQYYRARRIWDKAAEMALIALSRSPDNPDCIFALTLIRWNSKRITAAEAARAMMELAAIQEPEGLFRQASAALLEAGRVDEAVAYSEKSILATPLSADAYVHRATCLMQKKQPQLAEFAMAAAVSLCSNQPFYYHLYAKILSDLGRVDEAIATERKAIALGAGFVSQVNLAALLRRTGDYEESLGLYQHSLPNAGVHAAAIERCISELTAELKAGGRGT